METVLTKRDSSGSPLQGRLRGLAGWIVRHPRLVLAMWLVAIVASLPFASRVSDVLATQGASKVVAGTQSARVDQLVNRTFAHGSDGETVVVITARDVRAKAIKRFIATVYSELAVRAAHNRVAAVTSPWQGSPPRRTAGARLLIAPDSRAALLTETFAGTATRDPDFAGLRRLAQTIAARQGLTHSVGIHVTGNLALIHETYAKAQADNQLMETVAYLVIAVVLIAFFRAVLPAILTIATIGLAINVSQAGLYVLGHQVPLTQFTLTIMTFVMLGAGVDYSMLLSSRYRQERVAGMPVQQAVVEATARAGESMLLAGSAVTLAFGVTLLSPVDWIPPLGYGGLIGIPIILFAALTVTPSLLALLGDRFFWLGRQALADMESGGWLSRPLRAMTAIAYRRRTTVTLVFVAATIPFAALAFTSASTADPIALSPSTDARQGADVIARSWGRGELFPTVVAGQLAPGLSDHGHLTSLGRRRLDRLTSDLGAIPSVATVTSATRPFGSPLTRTQSAGLAAQVRRAYLAPNGAIRMNIVLRGDPFSAAARRAVSAIQQVAHQDEPGIGRLLVGGSTLVDQDYGHALRTSFWLMALLVSIGIMAVLTVALRSVLIPVRLIATILMTNVWAVGITILVFATVGGRPIIDDLPIFLIILMMGLGMDYEVFLITRVRELRRQGFDDAESASRAVVDTGRILTAAGLVMAGSLGSMSLSSTVMLQEYGVGLGVAVLFDATLIRLLLVPATLLLLGRYNWWFPSRSGARTTASAMRGCLRLRAASRTD
jgi:putative drug exporter of the RND superfamily